MKVYTVAHRYALALIKLTDKNRLVDIRSSLESFLKILNENKILREWLCDEEITKPRRNAVLRELAGALNMSPLVLKFLEVLIQKERMKYIVPIAHEFFNLADKAMNIIRGNITVAKDILPKKTLEKVEVSLGKNLGRQIILSVKEDPSLVGGVVVKLGNQLIDASTRKQLNHIKETICQ